MLLDDSELSRMRLIGETGEWTLYHRRQGDNPPWANLYLRRDVGRGKGQRTFWFGWNRAEKRLSKSDDARALRKRFPAIHLWAEATCATTQFR